MWPLTYHCPKIAWRHEFIPPNYLIAKTTAEVNPKTTLTQNSVVLKKSKLSNYELGFYYKYLHMEVKIELPITQ